MEVKTTIEVQAYADYDIRYTKCIMVSPDYRDVKDILKTYCTLRGLPNSEGKELPNNMFDDTTNDFIKYLKKEGFKELKSTEIYFTD